MDYLLSSNATEYVLVSSLTSGEAREEIYIYLSLAGWGRRCMHARCTMRDANDGACGVCDVVGTCMRRAKGRGGGGMLHVPYACRFSLIGRLFSVCSAQVTSRSLLGWGPWLILPRLYRNTGALGRINDERTTPYRRHGQLARAP